MTTADIDFMKQALALAKEAASIGEVPVGAVVVFQDQVIGEGFNRREIDQDPLAHAELLAIKQASHHLGQWRLLDCTLYVTLEPCAMCAGALVNARVKRVVFGASDPKAGACGSILQVAHEARLNHRLEITPGILAEESGRLLSDFFKARRA